MTDRQPVKIKKRPRPGRSLTNANRNAILSLLLAVATIALYSPVIGYPFLVFDDHDYVTANFHIHRGLAWSTIKWAFKSTAAANWHPFTWLSHALDYQLFAMNAAGHHLDSVLLHAINAVLLFLLLWWVTKRTRPSLLVAALFALHPINVESVAWIAEERTSSARSSSPGHRRLRTLPAQARLAPISLGSGIIRRGPDGQAHGDHSALFCSCWITGR